MQHYLFVDISNQTSESLPASLTIAPSGVLQRLWKDTDEGKQLKDAGTYTDEGKKLKDIYYHQLDPI